MRILLLSYLSLCFSQTQIEAHILLLLMPDLCTSQSIQIEVAHAGHISTLHRHCQISCTIKKTLSPVDVSYFKLSPSVPAVYFGSHAVSHGMFCTAGQGETKGSRDSPDLKARQNSWNYPPKGGCMSQFCHHLHLSLILLTSTKGNPCSRSSKHGDSGLFKAYKAA